MMRRLLLAVTVAALAVGVLAPAPAQAKPVAVFGPVVDVTGSGVDPYNVATAALPDGTVAVAWTVGMTSVRMAVRRPGANSFTVLTPRALEPGYQVALPGVPTSRPPVSLLAAGSEFLLGWGELGATNRVRVVRVPASATAVPAPTTVPGSADMTSTWPTSFGTATDGSAVAAWAASVSGGYEVRVARRPGATGAWQYLGPAGLTQAPYEVVAAIDTARSVTAAWLTLTGPTVQARVRSYGGGGWGTLVIAGEVSAGALGATRQLAAASSGAATVIAVPDLIDGTSSYDDDAEAPRAIRVMQRPSATAGWTLSAPVTGPGRYAVSPGLAMTPDRSAVLTFLDLASGSAPGAVLSVTTLVAQRRGPSGAWGPGKIASSVAVDPADVEQVTAGRLPPAAAPDGTLVLPLASPVDVGGGVIKLGTATAWRAGWDAGIVDQAPVGGVLPTDIVLTGMVVDPAGRATFARFDPAGSAVLIATTPLPKPLARSRAALSTTAPTVGTAVTCNSAWTGAKTLAYRWLRGGSPISGATAKAYTPKSADRNRSLSCRVTAGNPTGSTVSTSIARTVR